MSIPIRFPQEREENILAPQYLKSWYILFLILLYRRYVPKTSAQTNLSKEILTKKKLLLLSQRNYFFLPFVTLQLIQTASSQRQLFVSNPNTIILLGKLFPFKPPRLDKCYLLFTQHMMGRRRNMELDKVQRFLQKPNTIQVAVGMYCCGVHFP